MFARRYFADRYFPKRYFPKGGDGGTTPDPDPVTTGSITFPTTDRGSLPMPASATGLVPTIADWIERPGTTEITGDDDRNNRYTLNHSSADIIVRGSVGGAKRGYSHRSSITIGTVLLHPDSWTLSKYWPLQRITGDDDLVRDRWTWGTPTYSLSIRGTPTATGPLLTTRTFAVSIAADSIGTINFANGVSLDQFRMRMPINPGGRPYCSASGRYDGAVTYTPGTSAHDLSWLLINTGMGYDQPIREAIEWDTQGEVLEETVILYSCSLYFDRTSGSNIRFSAQMRVDGGA